ncbi:hypothetical protein L1049_002009 [Liquidambar formosana]|uniref:Glutathione S-transferase n=1 Tax=Liquidambar formosana TaxID=63359 RepID=A0AAP0NGA1_LIQFO
MEGQEVKLLGARFSIFAHRVEWVLKLKGIEYEVVEEDLTNKSPLLLNYNPIYKKVPVLLHHGNAIAESLVIIEYIDDTWKQNPIFPQDPYERATVRFWSKFVEEKVTDVIRRAMFLEGEQQEEEVKQAQDALLVLEGELMKGKKKFFGGDMIGVLDIVLGWITIWLGAVEEAACFKVLDPCKYPCIGKWMERFVELPVIKANSPPKDQLVPFFQKFRELGLALAAKK